MEWRRARAEASFVHMRGEKWFLSLNLHFLMSAVANLLYISELPVLYENTNVHWTVGDVGRSNTLLVGTLIGTIEENNLAISF